MIKCNVTVCGTITRSAQMRTNKEGKAFLAFGVSVVIAAKSGINKTFEISVAKDGGMPSKSAWPRMAAWTSLTVLHQALVLK